MPAAPMVAAVIRAGMRLTVGVIVVGLTGGIGAGKSEVAARLATHGAIIVDADRLAREAVAVGTSGLADVVARFGTEVIDPSGALDRARLAARVFADPAARRDLESIVHPRVRARTAEIVAGAPADSVVVNDVPLLVEADLASTCDLVVVVESDEAARVRRLMATRGMDEAEARARIRSQTGDEQRRAVADVIIPNRGTIDELWADVDALWRERLAPTVR